MTEQDGFDRGSTLHFDRFGNVVDISASLNERSALLSRMWRLELPYSVLSADGIYGTISFRTPATGQIIYNISDIQKTGNEVIATLEEGGTYSGGTAFVPLNFNFAADSCPLTAVAYGVSPTATLSGSTIKASKLVPGAAQGNVVPGGNSIGSGFFILKPSTTYTLKLLAKGGAANVAANFSVVYLRSGAF